MFRCNVSPVPLCYFQSLFLHTIVLFNPSATFNHPSINPSARFNGPPIISPPSNIHSTVPPSPHRSDIQFYGSLVIPRLCGVPFCVPSIRALLGNPRVLLHACSCRLVRPVRCGVSRGHGTVQNYDWVFSAPRMGLGALVSALGLCGERGGAAASLKVLSESCGNFHK